jgi:hypothetical protein
MSATFYECLGSDLEIEANSADIELENDDFGINAP